jgi:hypothetical protein
MVVLTTEDPPFASEPRPIGIELAAGGAPVLDFARPSAVLLRVWPSGGGLPGRD